MHAAMRSDLYLQTWANTLNSTNVSELSMISQEVTLGKLGTFFIFYSWQKIANV